MVVPLDRMFIDKHSNPLRINYPNALICSVLGIKGDNNGCVGRFWEYIEW